MALDTKRLDAQDSIHANYAAGFRRTMEVQAQYNKPQEQQELAAAKLGLNHALNKAAEQGRNPSNERPDWRQVREGQEQMQKAFGQKSESIVAALAGRSAGLELPRATAKSQDYDKLTTAGQNLAAEAVADRYMNRGRVQQIGSQNNYLDVAGSKGAEIKENLVKHMIYARAAIDHGEKTGQYDKAQAQMLQTKLEKQVFQPPETPGLKPEFKDFQKAVSSQLQYEVMQEVRKREGDKDIKGAVDQLYAKRDQQLANEQKARDFAKLSPDQALKKHPEDKTMMNAYAVLSMAEKSAQRLPETTREKFMQNVENKLANDIRSGQVATVQKTESKTIQVEAPQRQEPKLEKGGQDR